MTRKDYVLLAECIAFCQAKDARTPEEMRAEIVRTLCDTLREENPRFDAARFMAACKVDP